MTDPFAGQTVAQARRALTDQLRKHSIESPELDARLLAGAVLGLDLTGIIVQAGRLLTADEAARLSDFARRRCSGEPVARILGVRDFCGLPMRLSAATLVPRPDTETVVEAALGLLDADSRRLQPLRIADLGTGSGAILMALLSELPNAWGIGTDISLTALQTAMLNARRLGLAPRAGFVGCDYASAVDGVFDLIVANPPYIRSAEIASLAIEVRDHDPRLALDGGADGLDAYRAIVPAANRLLRPKGLLLVEVGQDQDVAVGQLMCATGLMPAAPPKADLAGIRRVVAGRKMPR